MEEKKIKDQIDQTEKAAIDEVLIPTEEPQRQYLFY